MVCWKHDTNGNPIGRSNQNSILDTCLHEGEMTELVVNIIAESMYSQCDVNGNEYLLLKAFIDDRKNGSALNVHDQKVVIEWLETLRKSTASRDICCEWKD